jgi:hypothetical protein
LEVRVNTSRILIYHWRRSLAARVGAHPAHIVMFDRHRFLYLWHHECSLARSKQSSVVRTSVASGVIWATPTADEKQSKVSDCRRGLNRGFLSQGSWASRYSSHIGVIWATPVADLRLSKVIVCHVVWISACGSCHSWRIRKPRPNKRFHLTPLRVERDRGDFERQNLTERFSGLSVRRR